MLGTLIVCGKSCISLMPLEPVLLIVRTYFDCFFVFCFLSTTPYLLLYTHAREDNFPWRGIALHVLGVVLFSS